MEHLLFEREIIFFGHLNTTQAFLYDKNIQPIEHIGYVVTLRIMIIIIVKITMMMMINNYDKNNNNYD